MNRRISQSHQVFLATRTIDMRKQINGLAQIIISQFGTDLYDGTLFVFCNRNRKTVKILCWDVDGFVLYHKRREQGRFPWPALAAAAGETISVSEQDMNRLLEGLVMEQFVPKPSYHML